MENKASIICLGHNENALVFNASGIQGIVVKDNDDFNKIVEHYINEGIKIFLVSDQFKEEIYELRETIETVYPIFLLLPLDGNLNHDGVETIRKDVERATGINLF